MELKRIAIVSIIGCCCFIYGCWGRMAASLAGPAVASFMDRPSDHSMDEIFLEQHIINNATIKISEIKIGIILAAEVDGKQLGNKILYADKENFLKLDDPVEKKQLIHKIFLEYAKVDLGPVEVEPEDSL
ncbi:MAG: hypothetical protein KKD50_06225 [Proteobacteria bacterium]|nr:hypothetical protein [Pseudomonadota bacterium]